MSPIDRLNGLIVEVEGIERFRYAESFERLQEQLDALDRIIALLQEQRHKMVRKIREKMQEQAKVEQVISALKSIAVPAIDSIKPNEKILHLYEEKRKIELEMCRAETEMEVDSSLGELKEALAVEDLSVSDALITQLASKEDSMSDEKKTALRGLKREYVRIVKEKLIKN